MLQGNACQRVMILCPACRLWLQGWRRGVMGVLRWDLSESSLEAGGCCQAPKEGESFWCSCAQWQKSWHEVSFR